MPETAPTLKEFLETILAEGERLIAEKLGYTGKPKHRELLHYEDSFREAYLNPLREELTAGLRARKDPYKYIRGIFAILKSNQFALSMRGDSEDFCHDGVLQLAGLSALGTLMRTALHNETGIASDLLGDIDKVEKLFGAWVDSGVEFPREEELALRKELAKSLVDPNSVFELLQRAVASPKSGGQKKSGPGQGQYI